MSARIAWALVNYGPLYSPVYTSHLRAIAKASRTLSVEELGAIGACGATDRMYTHSGENQVVHDFLGTDCTHLFMCESDMLLPDDTLPRLLAVGQPVASGVYFLRGGNGQPCLYKRTLTMKSHEYGMTPVSIFPESGPFRLNGCPGLGCVLFERRVFETVPAPWFDLKEGHYGSDLYFYTNVRTAGLEVWVDPGVACGQIEYQVWTIAHYHARLKEDPAYAAHGYILGTVPD